MSSTKLRVKLKAYEHRTLDKACAKIVDTVNCLVAARPWIAEPQRNVSN